MIKRLVWLSSGYVAGAASGWYVTRRVKRAAERFPAAVRNEVSARMGELGRRATPLPEHGRDLLQRMRSGEIDLTDRVRRPDRVRSRA